MALAIGTFYSTYQSKVGRRTQSRICVECLGNGEVAQDELAKRGWWNFHPWKRYDNKTRMTNDNVHKLGIFTNVWFRSMMMDKLLTAVDEESLDLNSPWTVDEFSTLMRDPDMASAKADDNAHDDRVMALGFPLFSLTVDDRPNQQTYRRSRPVYLPDAADDLANRQRSPFATYQPSLQALPLPAPRPAVFVRGRGTLLRQPLVAAERRFAYTARRPFGGR
jgi:hypothetical protein